MKLVCSVSIGNRILPTLSIKSNKKYIKSTLALCKHPKSAEYYIIHFSAQNKNGTKYDVKGNISKVLTRFISDGKATIQFSTPPHDLYIQADCIQLKGFLYLLKRVLENKLSEKELICSSMSVSPTPVKNVAPTKLLIKKRSDYPKKGFPRTLEILYINDVCRCSLDLGILQLTKLRLLDLSQNVIEFLPSELNNLPNLSELNMSWNKLGRGSSKQWSWLGGNLSRTLRLLNLSNNDLEFLPEHIVKLHALISLHLDNNELQTLPSGIGNLKQLKVLTVSNNNLTILPGSAKKWHLQNLDLSNNNFDPNEQSNPSVMFPKPLPVCTLKEYAGRKVLFSELLYSAEIVPYTIVNYLDNAHYCVCGNACFNVFIRLPNMLFLSTVAYSLYSSNGISYVPIDCYYCSLKCFGSSHYNHSRQLIVR